MALSRSSFSALRAFEAAARHLSVTRAARELNVTPGAISQQVRLFERELQVELFVRGKRGLALSDSGRVLSARLTEQLARIEQAVAEVAGDPGSRKLRLRVTPTFAIRWLVPRLTRFYEQHPEFEIEVGTYPRQEDVSVEEVDFVVRHGRGDWDDADCELLWNDALAPACSPALARSLHAPRDLLRQNLLHSMMRADAWALWLESQGLQGQSPRRTTKLANAAVTYQAAIDGMGIALAQVPYVREDLASGRLVLPFAGILRTGSGYYLACARRKSNQSNIRLFRQWIRTLAREEPRDRIAPVPRQESR